MRGEVLDFAAGFTVVDDSYNSNPRSLINMVRTITEAGDDRKRRIVIAGEMLELGPDAARLHRDAGREIARRAWTFFGVFGVLRRNLVAGARCGGVSSSRFFEQF